jgi:hypothetical protein
MKDLAVPVVTSEYLHKHLGGDSIVEVMEAKVTYSLPMA